MTLPDDNEEGRPVRNRATSRSDHDEARFYDNRLRRQRSYVVFAEQVRLRVLQDALAEGLAVTFERRAALLEWARPRPGDFVGRAAPAELAARDARLRADADRCRRHAALLLETNASAYDREVRRVLAEVA